MVAKTRSSGPIYVGPGQKVKLHPNGPESVAGIFAYGGKLAITGHGTDITTHALVEAAGSKTTVKTGATLDLLGKSSIVDATSTIVIGPGGTLVEGAQQSLAGTVHFADTGTGELVLDQSGKNLDSAGPITGFINGDSIDLANVVVSGGAYDAATHTLVLYDGQVVVGELNINSADLKMLGQNGEHLTFTSQGSGTLIGIACFLPDTMILTETGERRARDIAIGDRLITLSGEAKPVKFVGRRTYSAAVAATDPQVAPVTIRRGALDGVLPERDLMLSPCHAMLLDGVLIPAGELVNGLSIVRSPVGETIEYYNFEFEGREMIYAEGAPTESGRARGNSAVYDNWAEYATLYPHEAPELTAAAYPVPRLDSGFQVEAVRRHIDALAGIATAEPETGLGALEGWVANRDGNTITGVAWNASSTVPAVLEIVVDGTVVGETVANHYRPGRLHDGHRNGLCGFQVSLPETLSPFARHVVSVRRKADGAELAGAPYLIEAATKLAAPTMAAALDRGGDVATIDMALAALANSGEALLQARSDIAGFRTARTAAPMRRGLTGLVAANANDRQAA